MKSQRSSTKSFSVEENQFLDAFFRANHDPTEKEKSNLSKILQTSTNRISIWFCRRRNQEKKEHWRENVAPLLVEKVRDLETKERGLPTTSNMPNKEDMSEGLGFRIHVNYGNHCGDCTSPE